MTPIAVSTPARRHRLVAVAAAAALLLLPVAQPAEAHPGKQKTLRKLINAYRAEKNKSGLKMNDTLKKKAHKQAKNMAEQGKLVHSTQAQMTNYAKAANCSAIGEIIADTRPSGPHTLDLLMRKWKDSSVHNGIMLDGKWKKIGPGVHVDGNGALWSAVLFCK